MKQISIFDFLTDQQVSEAWKLFVKCGKSGTSFHDAMTENLKPLMPEIDKKLGQENSPEFLAYAVEYVFLRHANEK